MTKITSENINKKITIKGILVKAEQPHPAYTKIVYQCTSCLAKYESIQNSLGQINTQYTKPHVCLDCASQTFKINLLECEFTDIQKAEFKVNNQLIEVYFKNSLCNEYENGYYEITGVLRVNTGATPFYYYLDNVDMIRRI